jgi:hypothetical protein
LAALVVTALFVTSWFAPGTQVTRAVVAFIPVAVLMVAVELTAEAGQKLSKRECWHLCRASVRSIRPWRRVWIVLLNVAIASSAFLILLQTRPPSSTAMSLLRLAAGVALLHATAALVFEVASLWFLLMGYSLPMMHRNPIAARSVGEFWGQRWNRIVSAWLRTFIFLPLARRRAFRMGVLCSFFVSGALHGWPMLAALGISAALSTTAFFNIQGFFVLAENRLAIHNWPVAVARVWTVITLLTSSPLYIDPALRLFGF